MRSQAQLDQQSQLIELEQCKCAKKHQDLEKLQMAKEKAKTQLMEAMQIVQTARERELLAPHHFKQHTEEVYKLQLVYSILPSRMSPNSTLNDDCLFYILFSRRGLFFTGPNINRIKHISYNLYFSLFYFQLVGMVMLCWLIDLVLVVADGWNSLATVNKLT